MKKNIGKKGYLSISKSVELRLNNFHDTDKLFEIVGITEINGENRYMVSPIGELWYYCVKPSEFEFELTPEEEAIELEKFGRLSMYTYFRN